MQKTMGSNFVNTFSKNMAAEQPTPATLPQTNLSTKTGINKKKTTALQQDILNQLSIPSMGQQQQGA